MTAGQGVFSITVVKLNGCWSHIIRSVLGLIIEYDMITRHENVSSIVCLLLEVALFCQLPSIVFLGSPNNRCCSTHVFHDKRNRTVFILQRSLVSLHSSKDNVFQIAINLSYFGQLIGACYKRFRENEIETGSKILRSISPIFLFYLHGVCHQLVGIAIGVDIKLNDGTEVQFQFIGFYLSHF